LALLDLLYVHYQQYSLVLKGDDIMDPGKKDEEKKPIEGKPDKDITIIICSEDEPTKKKKIKHANINLER